jgi:hypothetical protein
MTQITQTPAPYFRQISAGFAAILLLGAAGCAKPNSTPSAVEVRVVEKLVEVQRPCPATKPDRPAPLPRPLPTDSVQLAALLGLKLAEWSAPGGYGDRASAVMDLCITP